jgi:hypothetical protein
VSSSRVVSKAIGEIREGEGVGTHVPFFLLLVYFILLFVLLVLLVLSVFEYSSKVNRFIFFSIAGTDERASGGGGWLYTLVFTAFFLIAVGHIVKSVVRLTDLIAVALVGFDDSRLSDGLAVDHGTLLASRALFGRFETARVGGRRGGRSNVAMASQVVVGGREGWVQDRRLGSASVYGELGVVVACSIVAIILLSVAGVGDYAAVVLGLGVVVIIVGSRDVGAGVLISSHHGRVSALLVV